MKTIKAIGAAIMRNKKFSALIMTGVIWVLAKLGLDLSMSDIEPLFYFVGSYFLGQGVADFGKEAAKVTMAAQQETAQGASESTEKKEATG